MKAYFLFILFSIASLTHLNAQQKSQQIQQVSNFNGGLDSSIILDIPYFRISGIGSASSSNSGKLDPSFNPSGDFTFSQKKLWRAFFLVNVGADIDSSKIDSLQLASFFFPDKSKSGFSLGFYFDLFKIKKIGELLKATSNSLKVFKWTDDKKNPEKYFFMEFEPGIEYSYLRKNIRNNDAPDFRVQTSNWIAGLKFSANMVLPEINFGIQIFPYYKWVTVTDGTYENFNKYFNKYNNNMDIPQTNRFFGLNISLNFKQFIIGFNFEDYKGNAITTTDVFGGVYTIKASVSADILTFK